MEEEIREVGRVEIPQDEFLAVLKVNEHCFVLAYSEKLRSHFGFKLGVKRSSVDFVISAAFD